MLLNQIWCSDEFTLEPLPDGNYGIRNKAALYFPKLWSDK